jgi:hypothetical protein
MARQTNAMITYNDAQFMVANSGFLFKIQGCPSTNQCMTKSEIDKYLVTDPSSYTGYSNNQLVPFDKLNRGLSVQPFSPFGVFSSGSTFNVVIQSSTSWTIISNVGWLTFNTAFGSGNTTVITTFSTNGTGSTRTGTVTIEAGNQTYVLTVNQLSSAGVPVTLLTVGYNISSSSNACSNFALTTIYIATGGALFTAQIYSSSAGTTAAAAGFYSDGTGVREWNGTGWIGLTAFC